MAVKKYHDKNLKRLQRFRRLDDATQKRRKRDVSVDVDVVDAVVGKVDAAEVGGQTSKSTQVAIQKDLKYGWKKKISKWD